MIKATLCIKKEPLHICHKKVVKDGSEYFGPYTSFKTVNTILELIKELYPLRSCKYDLSKSNIETGNLKFVSNIILETAKVHVKV
jgi:excinuclease ABC subunit C